MYAVPKRIMSSLAAGKVFFYTVSVFTTGLGIWQVQRFNWKTQRIEESIARSADPAVPVISSNGENFDQKSIAKSCEHLQRKRVSISGKYIEGHDVLLGPRSAPLTNGRQAAQGMSVNPQGYFVYSPFQLAKVTSTDKDSGKNPTTAIAGPIVYVNRGWVALRQEKWGIQKHPVRLECVVVEGEKGSSFSPPHDLPSKKLLWLDLKALVEASEIDSVLSSDSARNELHQGGVVVMDLVGVESEDKGDANRDSKHVVAVDTTELPIPKEPYNALTDYYVTPETHAAYAFTWFSLAICSLAISYLKFRKPTATAAQLRRLKNSQQNVSTATGKSDIGS